MELLRQAGDVASLIQEVRDGGGALASNLYLAEDVIARAVAGGELSADAVSGAVVFLRREALFDRIYFAAAAREPLERALAALPDPAGRRQVADLVGRSESLAPWKDSFLAAGWSRYAGFLRMQRLVPPGMAALETSPLVEEASARDAEAVLALLHEHFDVYSEHLPSLEDIRRTAAAGSLLVIRDENRLAAFFYYDRAGLTANFRFWIVLPPYRSLGYGDLLMRRYLQKCADCRRSLLWVRETNTAAIRVYRWYGYKPDSTIDEIFIRE
jgi:ribosomal protein S18 acetylase RimI-like enzyme